MMITSAIIAIRPLPIAIHHRRHHEEWGARGEIRNASGPSRELVAANCALTLARCIQKCIKMHSHVFKCIPHDVERRLYLHIVYGLKV